MKQKKVTKYSVRINNQKVNKSMFIVGLIFIIIMQNTPGVCLLGLVLVIITLIGAIEIEKIGE